jgi:hypothetical protein
MFGLGGIVSALMPLVTAAVTAWNKSKDVSIAAIQSAGGIAAAQAQAMTAWIGHPFSPPSLLAYSVSFYYAKSIAYDNIISYWITGHAGYTAPLIDTTAYVASVVIAGMFFSGIANIIKR